MSAETSRLCAKAIMAERSVGSLLVTDGDRVLGIVTRADLAKDGSSSDAKVTKPRCKRCHGQHRLRTTAGGEQVCAECSKGRRSLRPGAFPVDSTDCDFAD